MNICFFKLILGFFLAGIIGLERSAWNKPAGFRTHALLGISSVLIMLCGEYIAQKYNADPTRIPAQLLSGIGFIGAGTILRDGFNVKGLTNASGYIRRELSSRLKLRKTPELRFIADNSIEHSAMISKMIDDFAPNGDNQDE